MLCLTFKKGKKFVGIGAAKERNFALTHKVLVRFLSSFS